MPTEITVQSGFVVLKCAPIVKLGDSAQEFSDALQKAVRHAPKGIIIDFSRAVYMDTSGVGELVGYFAICMKAEKMFALATVPERIRSLFETTELRTVFPTFATVDEAINALGSLAFPEYVRDSSKWVFHPATAGNDA